MRSSPFFHPPIPPRSIFDGTHRSDAVARRVAGVPGGGAARGRFFMLDFVDFVDVVETEAWCRLASGQGEWAKPHQREVGF
jgi:hypothetical protein